MKKRYQVVAAVVVQAGRVLCVRKGETRYSYTSHRWEFPGGKIEPGESPQVALHRELLEELHLDVRVGDQVLTVRHEYPDFEITLMAYMCRITQELLELTEHEACVWMNPVDLMSLEWCAADIPIAKKVQKILKNCSNS